MANEKRLIDANALDEKIEILKVRYKAQGRDSVAEDYNFVQTVLLTAPTVDAVEVVRCKDCKHWDEYHIGSLDGPGTGDGACIEDPHNWIDHKRATDFCSYGERKDNERKAD